MNLEVKWALFLLTSVFHLEIVNADIFDVLHDVLGIVGDLIPGVPEIGKMNTTQLCQHFQLECEEHELTTDDGYILTLINIKGDKTKPLLMWHGLLDTSDTYLLRGDNSSGKVLSKEGYDIWLGNSRGNRYSRRHKTLDPDKIKDKKKFWDFSFHEMGYYDLAATIDYVLAQTGQEQVSAIGHSQGTSMFYALASTRPEYNKKIKIFISLAPIAYLTHYEGLAKGATLVWVLLSEVFSLLGIYEIFKANNFLFETACTAGLVGNLVCREIVAMGLSGFDNEELEPEFIKVVIGHWPAGSSKKCVDHYIQNHLRKRFARYDYGALNSEKYHSDDAPDYDLKKITAPVALLVGANDKLSTVADVELLRSELPNMVYYKLIDRKEFNHLDFVWAKNLNTYINPELTTLLKQYS